ncbi:MAG: flagellar motor protein MotB, partial [Sideroxydans sp. RIFOXYB12_FULL_59_6]
KKGEIEAEKKVINLKAAKQEFLRLEAKKEIDQLRQLKKNIEAAIENNKKLEKFKNQILLDLTTEGLRIQIVDEKNRPMFQSGSAQLEDYTRDILREIGQTLNEMPNKVSLSGHTDAQPFAAKGGRYSNWELSADRANASRRELIAGGLAGDKIVRVVGLSSAVLFDKAEPENPINRRISIIVMNKKAEEAAQQDGGTVQIDAESGDAADALGAPGAEAVSPEAAPAANEVHGIAPAEVSPVQTH